MMPRCHPCSLGFCVYFDIYIYIHTYIHYITLHCIVLHYITLHTYIHVRACVRVIFNTMLEQLNMCVTITSPTVATKVTCVAPWCTGPEGSLPHRLGRLHPPAAWGIAWAACTAWMDGWMDGCMKLISIYIYVCV